MSKLMILHSHWNKYGKDSIYVYPIVETVRVYAYDGAGKLLFSTETEENQDTYTYTYDVMETGYRL